MENKDSILKFAANMKVSPMITQGGHLFISGDELYFKPHVFNFGKKGETHIQIKDICGYNTGYNKFVIYYGNNEQMELVAWDDAKIINILEQKRHEYFNRQGLSIPQLLKGEVRSDAIGNVQKGNTTLGKSNLLRNILIFLGILSLLLLKVII